MATFATGVTVVTVSGGSPPYGITANTFTSVSLRPPLILVCVAHDAVMHEGLRAARHFGISVLAADQGSLAHHFADRTRPLGLAQFEGVRCRLGKIADTSMITGALAGFECLLRDTHPASDHTIFIGEVLALDHRNDSALLFYNGRFRRLPT
jgi:flavin reductase (DIM6/NTAB) family NADH-FMN oxidoreductase RutF